MDKQNTDVLPIIYRVTQKTFLDPTTLKSPTHSSQQSDEPQQQKEDPEKASATTGGT